MSPVKAIPEGRSHAIPHLIIDGAAQAIEFYKKAFNATEIGRVPAPDGKRLMHAEVQIGNSVIFLCDDFPEYCGGKPNDPKSLGGTGVTIHQYVTNCDEWITRAEKAGAKVTMPAVDQFWGDRYGSVKDPFGHNWSFATHIKDLTPTEMEAGMKEAFSQPA